MADYATMVEDRPIMSAKYRFPVTLTKTVLRSSLTVSLRQLSFLLYGDVSGVPGHLYLY